MLDFEQKRKLLKLRDEYKYDIALMKQKSPKYNFETEEQELEILAALKLSRDLKQSVEEFMDTIGGLTNLGQFIELGAICNEPIGKLAFQLDQQFDKTKVDSAIQVIDNARNHWRIDKDE